MNKEKWKILILSSLGGGLEFYDFVIYAIFASYIGKTFFPAENRIVSLIAAFLVFAIGYLARPIGGVIFSHLGDKIGRKKTFTATVFLMGISSLLIAFIPGYHYSRISIVIFLLLIDIFLIIYLTFLNIRLKLKIWLTLFIIFISCILLFGFTETTKAGLAATTIFCSLRIIQGFSLGGELPGSITFICEHIKEKPGLACGTLYFFVNSGIIFAVTIHWLLFLILPNATADNYGWRIAFFIGGLLAVISYSIRTYLNETPEFEKIKNKIRKVPIITLFKKHISALTYGFLIASFGGTIVALLYLFITSYMISILHYDPSLTNLLVFIGTFAYSFTILFSGYLSDILGARKVVMLGIITTVISSVPYYYILVSHSSFSVLLFMFILIALVAGFTTGAFPVILTDIFPVDVRYTGISTSYNLAYAIFCGLTPFLSTTLIGMTRHYMCPAYILIGTAVMCLIGLIGIYSSPNLKSGYLNKQ